MAGASIRVATPTDYPALRAVATCGGPAAREGLPDGATFAARPPTSPALVALLDDRVVGYLLASPLAFDGDAPVSLWLEAVMVAPERRRRGLATALCAALAATARVAGGRALLAGTPTSPAMAALLARVGFVAHRDGVLLWRLDAN